MSLRNAFLVILLPLLLYLPPIWNSDFVALDDELLILDNETTHGLSFEHIKKAFGTFDPELYIPLTLLSYQVEYNLFGLNPLGFHLTNLLLHIGNALLVMGLVFLLLFSPPPWGEGQGEGVKRTFLYPLSLTLSPRERETSIIPLLSALLFAIHPLNTEAVMWASARKDLLMGFLFLLSLNFYVRWNHLCHGELVEPRSQNTNGSQWYYASISMFALACMAKVTAVMLPFILLLIDWYYFSLPHGGRARERGSIWNFMLNKIPYFVISLLFIFIALFGKHAQASFLTPFLISFVAIPFSIGKFFYPTNLSIFYPFTDDVVWTNPSILGGTLLIVTITVSCWLIRKRSNILLLSWFAFLILLSPSLTNVLKGGGYDSLDVYITSDRYMYLPLLTLLPLTAYILTRKPLIYGAPVILLLLSYATFTQARSWRSSETLFAHAIASQKNAHVAYTNLAGIHAQNGDLDRALQLYEKSKAIKPTWRTLFNLGQMYSALGRYPDAINAYQELLVIRPDYAEALAQLGGLLLQTGNIQEALTYLERARMFDPNITSVHYNLGLIYEHGGNPTKARESFQRVLELNPEDIQAKGKLEHY